MGLLALLQHGSTVERRVSPRLARLAAACLGEELLDTDIKRFATKRMLFIEFCPYASPSFTRVPWLKVKQIAHDDVGFRCTRDIRQIIFTAGRPALVLANGKYAAYDVKDWQCPDAQEVEIARSEAPEVKMKVWTSWFATDGYRFPVVGFNQLGRRNSHATTEADLISRFVREQNVLHQFEER